MTMLVPELPPLRLGRRAFVAWTGVVMARLGLRRPSAGPGRDGPEAGQDAGLEPALLAGLASAVLPAELGSDGVDAAVRGFRAWMRGYRPKAELLHGYGTGDLSFTTPLPTSAWRSQLAALDEAARRTHGTGFAAASATARAALVRESMRELTEPALPAPHRASHVAVALLAWYMASPDATDRCYGAAIMPNQCRPLAENTARPLPLRRRGPDGAPRRLGDRA